MILRRQAARTGPRTTRAPGVVIQRTVAEGIADRLGEDLTGEPIRVSFHDVPLDASGKDSIEEAVFTYEVRNTQAEELVETLNQILGAGAGAGVVPPPEPRETRRRDARGEGGESRENDGQTRRETGQAPPVGQAGGRIVVDRNRNMLLFRGSGKEWAEIRSVIERLDRAVPSVLIEVLIEVLIAEVTLPTRSGPGSSS